ncbi:hypothetical protein T439DRAFT_324430 [Meredithblackwellia eburnea MCA 4105]
MMNSSSIRRVIGNQTRRLSTTRPARAPAPRYTRFGDPLPTNYSKQHSSQQSSQLPFNLRSPPRIVWILLGGGTTWYILHLEQVPQSGRWRYMHTSKAMEHQMGQEAYRDVMHQFGNRILPKDHPLSKQVTHVARRLIDASGLQTDRDGSQVMWEVNVVKDDDTKNAFVLPGGKIFVFTGILPVCKDQDGLAAVLGHEIAHQVARHSAEKVSFGMVLMALNLVLQSMGVDAGLGNTLLNLLMGLPNSRTAESEADYIGLQLSTRACFDPRAAQGLWERMDSSSSGEGGKKGRVNLDFLSTHPSSGKRVVKVREWAREMIGDRPQSCGPLVDEFARSSGLGGGGGRLF